MKYSWKITGIYKADPNVIAEEIESIGKSFTVKDVVEKARNEETNLHNLFEWNDEIAGEKYREIQAGNIVRNLVIVKQIDDETEVSTGVRVFVNNNQRDNMYKHITSVVSVAEDYERLLNQALNELQAFKNKYSKLKELDDIFNVIEELVS